MSLVARMKRSVMRGKHQRVDLPIPDCASLHPGYNSSHEHFGNGRPL